MAWNWARRARAPRRLASSHEGSTNQGWEEPGRARDARGGGDVFLAEAGAGGEGGEREAVEGLGDMQGDVGGVVFGGDGSFEDGEAFGGGFARGSDVENDAAADGGDRGEEADDEAVAGKEEKRLVEAEADVGAAAGLERGGGADAAERGFDFSGAGVEMDGGVVFERLGGGEEVEGAVDELGAQEAAGGGEGHAAVERCGVDAGEVEGGALAGGGSILRLAMDLDAAHAGGGQGRVNFHFIAGGDGAGGESSGGDGAEAVERKGAVERQAEIAVGGAGRDGGGEREEALAKFVQTRPGDGAYRDDGRAFEEGAANEFFDFQFDELDDLGVDEIGLGKNYQAAGNSEQAADVEMLASLGHDGLVGGYDEESEIDAAGAGEHVLHEPLVAGHVDDGEAEGGGKIEMSETEIDGNAALFFFFEPVGVDAG